MAKKTQQVKPIYVVAGKDTSLVKQRVHEIVEQLLPPDQHATALLSMAGKDAVLSQVLDELRTLPFLADCRVVVIQEAEAFVTANRSALEAYFDNPSATGRLILAVSSWAKNTKLAKKLTGVGELIAVDPPKPWHMAAHLVDLAKTRYQKKLAKPAAELLVMLTGDDWTRICGELEKLVIFVGSASVISVDDVERLVGHNRVYGAFDVIDAMSAGRTGEALQRLRNMFAEDKSAQYTVVGAFAYHFRRLFTAKALLAQGRSPGEISKQLRLWGKTDQFFAQLRRLSLEQLGRHMEELADIDFAIKTGKTRPPVAIERLITGAVCS